MDMIQQTLQKAVDQLVIDLTDTIREATLNELAQILGVPNIPQLPPMSNRRHLKPAQTKGPTELPKQLGKALNKLKKSKRPVTSTMVAETLGTNENNARQVLAKLLKKRLVTTEMLGDGTARKVYLPAKS
jgi:predicted ArsR family transcriptional regulator